jgi:hypothetical protein
METEVTEERLVKYFNVTRRALDILKIATPEGTHLFKAAEDFLDMAKRYFNDAVRFKNDGKWVDAFAALNYAHGWLDAGARLGLFDVQHNSELFTVD